MCIQNKFAIVFFQLVNIKIFLLFHKKYDNQLRNNVCIIYFQNVVEQLKIRSVFKQVSAIMRDLLIFRSLSIKNDFSPLLKLAIPLVITGVIQSSVGFFETIFLAHLGDQALAAGALVAWLFFTLIVLLFGTFNSINILVAHKYGANDHQGISLVLRDGLILAVLLVIPTFFLLWNMAPIFLLFGQKPELVTLAKLYLHGIAWGLLPRFILIVLFEFIIGLGHTRVSMIFTMISIPLYIFFSYVLIFGKFGFPELAIAGAGWGMTIGDWITTSALCIYVVYSKKYRNYIRSIFTFSKAAYLWEILQLGVPMGLMFSIEVGFFFAMTLLMGLIGIQSLAANQVTMQYLGPLMGIIFCIAQAITVRMGHQLGAKQIASAERASYAGISLAIFFMIIVAFFYWVIPEMLISIDFNVHDPNNIETVQIAKQFLFIAAFFQILESIRISLFGALRGLKDTRFTLLASIISFWCIALPVGYVLSISLNMGGKSFWWGMVIGVSCSVALLYLRFKHKIRTYMEVEKLAHKQ